MEGIRKLFSLWFKENYNPDSQEAKYAEKFSCLMKKNNNREKKDKLYLREKRLVVLDTETTGFKPNSGDEIISIGACAIKGDQILPERFHKLVNPHRPIPPLISELTGIDDEMVADADDFCAVIGELLEFIEDSIIIGHCIDFDLNFINHKLKPYNAKINNFHIDTDTLSRAINPQWKIHTLDSILSNLGIFPEGRHTAQGDSLLTAMVFLTFINSLEEVNVTTLMGLESYINFSRMRM